ncbi:MAG: hypothetical protein Fur0010_05570 [Bdellovibrio sp.]
MLSLTTLSTCAGIKPVQRNSTEEISQSDLEKLEKEEEQRSQLAVSRTDNTEVLSEVALDQADESKEEIEVERNSVNEKLNHELSSVAKTAVNTSRDLKLNYFTKHYDFWMNYFTKRDKERFLRHLENGMTYYPIVTQMLKEQGMPEDLFFVALIESGFNMKIKSRASAVGPWQFIKGTAHRYGLRVDSQVDERKNLFKATIAASNYFKDLYNIFGNWELALCAYNSGEYRVINAIRKGNTRDYRELVSKKLLPKETIYYIPKIAVARELALKSGKGIGRDHETKLYQGANEVTMKSSFSVSSLAKATGISKSIILALNPDIKQDRVRVGRRHHSIFLPKSVDQDVIAKLKPIQVRKVASVEKVVAAQANKKSEFIYKVKRGDHLTKIATMFGVSIGDIKKRNKMRSSRVLVGQKLVIPQVRIRIYTVRRGDNLYRLARRFNTSVEVIVAVNSLNKKQIYPNQVIKIPEES